MQRSLDIFKAEPQSVFDLICDQNNTGFYMPAYQRPYAWEETHIRDLFADCENVFRNLLESPDAIIFLGSILSVDDSAASAIYPLVKRHIPAQIKLVIDGQQRLSTLMLMIMCINERLNMHLPKLKKLIDKETDDQLIDTLENLKEKVCETISNTSRFVVETQADHDLYKCLPKIIRSQIDCWGKDSKNAVYQSPIAAFMIAYQEHLNDSKDANTFKAFDLNKLNKDSSARLVNNIKEIRKQLNVIEDGFEFKNADGSCEELISIEDLLKATTLEKCLDFPVDQDLCDATKEHDSLEKIVFLTAFSKFVLHRVCLTYVEVNNESYAFDMFEALNTTGEPLTAIETFVPKVIEHIGKKRKEENEDGIIFDESADESMTILTSISDRFGCIIKSKEKNDKVKALIIAFIRAYEGKVLITSLRNQRDALLKTYESCRHADKDTYLRQLAKSAELLFDHWYLDTPEIGSLVSKQDKTVANLCLRYLTDVKHDITQSLLIHFMLQDGKYSDTGKDESALFQAIKAVTAFSVLWRAMSGGSDGIDTVYKKLHEKGGEIAGEAFKAYQLKSSDLSSNEYNISTIKNFFKNELAAKIHSKQSPKDTTFDQWLDICSKQPLLSTPKNTKLLILAGFHGIKLSEHEFVRSDEPITQCLTPIMWDLISAKNTIKKVYDVNAEAKWGDPDISQPEIFNKLGNVLVDARDKLSTDKSWLFIKDSMLSALANNSTDEIGKILSNEEGTSAEARKNASALLLETKYAEITYADSWNKQAINERTELLLKNAWTNLYEWLN